MVETGDIPPLSPICPGRPGDRPGSRRRPPPRPEPPKHPPAEHPPADDEEGPHVDDYA
ncbi:hypothetical protein BMS3Bbin12_00950 [bacterium BMS3Bbin12]|nr:hypothetical protein BMS3Abin12_02179 [bacterium BMS3Abin12]GBE47783.1 hypothetical protein BMS3Bbin12_00950 [bacterium BMS3Bbin12]GBE49893.1 hypothetical protein BMS3Bbin13_00818 [bacterium BMS3Bbin13]